MPNMSIFIHVCIRAYICMLYHQERNNSEILLNSISDTKHFATCWSFVPIKDVMYYCPRLAWRAATKLHDLNTNMYTPLAVLKGFKLYFNLFLGATSICLGFFYDCTFIFFNIYV